jgi:hypothetical protein
LGAGPRRGTRPALCGLSGGIKLGCVAPVGLCGFMGGPRRGWRGRGSRRRRGSPQRCRTRCPAPPATHSPPRSPHTHTRPPHPSTPIATRLQCTCQHPAHPHVPAASHAGQPRQPTQQRHKLHPPTQPGRAAWAGDIRARVSGRETPVSPAMGGRHLRPRESRPWDGADKNEMRAAELDHSCAGLSKPCGSDCKLLLLCGLGGDGAGRGA